MKVSGGRGWYAIPQSLSRGRKRREAGSARGGKRSFAYRDPGTGLDCLECPIFLLRNAEGFRLFGRRGITSRRRVGSFSGGKGNMR